MSAIPRNFTIIAQQAADTLTQLRRYERGRLSGKAFLKQALAVAKADSKRLLEIQTQLEQPLVSPDVRGFVRKMIRLIADGLISETPVKKMAKLVHAYGSPAVEVQALTLGITIPELFALSVKRAIEHKPESFGTLENADDRQQKTKELRDTLDVLYREMRDSWTARDLVINRADAEASSQGLARFNFVLCPGLHAGEIDWPQRLVEHLMKTAAVPEAEGPPPIKRKSILPIIEPVKVKRRSRSDTETEPAEVTT